MRIAVCPQPPLLVPAVSDSELIKPVRADARAAASWLIDGADSVTVLVSEQIEHDQAHGGSLAPIGVPAQFGGPIADLPLGATVAAWLLDGVGWAGPRRYLGPDAFQTSPDRTGAVLVMADGTACRDDRAPGAFDPRAHRVDQQIASWLASGAAAELAELDLALAEELWMDGGAALVAIGVQVSKLLASGARIHARLRHHSAPFGVGYWVGEWEVT